MPAGGGIWSQGRDGLRGGSCRSSSRSPGRGVGLQGWGGVKCGGGSWLPKGPARALRAQPARQRGGSPGEVPLALGPPGPPAACSGQAVPGRPQAPEAPPSCSRGREPEPTRPAGGGNKEPLLPARSSRSRFWPCPLVLARRHLALAAAAQPPQAPACLPGGAVRCENPVWGSSLWGALGRLPSPTLAGLCRLLWGSGLGSRAEPRPEQAGPLPHLSSGEQNTSAVSGTLECPLWVSVCSEHAGIPPHGLTASTDASLTTPHPAHILPILFLRK